MGRIILHAGMSKTGTSSIQRWLAEQVQPLRERGIRPVRVVQSSPGAPIRLVPSTDKNAKSTLVEGLRRSEDPESRVATLKQILDLVDAEADRSDLIVVSNEGYEALFQDDVRQFREELDVLAGAHDVRVAYYVRPQHAWLEAAWRQWGFRHPQRPSAWLRRQEPRLRYWRTLNTIREQAPRLGFEMRPFRSDLLAGGDVVPDFAETFLGIDDVPRAVADDGWSNRGFPLELSILLRDAPQDLFWSSLHDNLTLDRLRTFVVGWQLPESESTTRSRAILQGYAYRAFEPENQELIRDLDWPTQHFVPPDDDGHSGDDERDLAAIDELWTSNSSPAERALLFSALRELVS